MSASTGPTSKGEKGKSKYQSLDINSIYNSTRSEASEAQTTKSTLPRKHGMQQLGKVPQRRPPANLPSLKSENSGNDPSVSLVPPGVQGWGLKPGESQQLTPSVGGGNLQSNQTNQNAGQTQGTQGMTSQPSPAPAVGAVAAASQPQTQQAQQASQAQQQSAQDKTWSSITGGGGIGQGGPGSGPADGGPSFLAHQSPQFRQEFPSLSEEPGAVQGLQATPAYGPGPSLRPQTEPTSWTQTKPPSQQQQQHPAHQPPLVPSQFKAVVPSFMMSQSSGFPMFPESIQKKSRSQASPGPHPDSNRINRMMGGSGGGRGGGGGGGGGEGEDLVMSRPIIREEELVKMDELTRDPSWAAANDDIDYNEDLSFSDGESVEEEKDKFKDKSKQQQQMREDKKDDMDKMSRDKGFMPDRDRDRDRGQQQWRSAGGMSGSVPSSNYSDFRNSVPRQLMQGGGRMDEDEIWKEKRRQMSEHKQLATERAKQRKEEEEKRFEETVRAKRNNRDDGGGGVNAPSSSDWDDRTKISGDNFRQMTQFPLESRPNMNREKERERDMRQNRDRDNQSSRYHQSRPPRFNRPKDTGGSKQGQPWSGHPPGPFPSRRNNDQSSDDQHERFRVRDERDGKRNYYDSQSMDHSQQYHERDYDRDYRSSQSHHHQSDKEVSGRDVDKELRDSPKAESDHRNFEDIRNRREPKQQNDHYEDKESDRRDRRGEYGGSRGEASSERPSRPDSRDSRASRDSDHRPLPDPSDTFHDSYLVDKIDRLTLGKDMRREPQVRGRDHVPGPITQEKLVAYEHKHSQSQLEKCDGSDKASDDKRLQRNDGECSSAPSQAWAEDKSPDTGLQALHAQAISPAVCPGGIVTSADTSRQGGADMSCSEEGKLGKSDDSDKRKENGGERGGRDRRDDLGGGLKSLQQGQGGGQPAGRNNRGSARGGGGHRNNSYPSKYNAYQQQQGQMWQHSKERSRQQQSSRGGRSKHWDQSESDGSGDEVSIGSGKDDKKNDKKHDGMSKMGTWKPENKERRDDKKDSKIKESSLGGANADSDKDKMKDKKGESRGAGMGESSRKSVDGGGFGPKPTGEVSRRGRGGMRGQSRLGMGPTSHYGPPGSKPFSSAGGMGPHQTNASAQHDSHQPSSPPHHMGRKEDGGKGEKSQRRGKNAARSQDENWETTSETSDGSGTKRPNKMRSRSERKVRGGMGGGGTIGDKRNLLNSQQQHHINGKPDSEDRKSNKDDSDTPPMPYSNNGFQEVKSKKGGGKEGRGVKEEGNKRSRSKGKEKMGGIKGQQKSFSREFVNNKPPRLQRLDASRKQQLAQAGANSPDVSDMNKINQNVSSLFPPPRNSNPGSEVSCPPAHNAWNKPINASLRTTSPLGPAPVLTQLTVATAQITQDKTTALEDLSQVGGSAPSATPTADKTIAKLNREVVDKSLLEGPPVNTIIFENTNYKREPPGDIGSLKQCYPMKPPSRNPMDKPRDRKMDEELPEGSHALSLGGFKAAAASASDLQSPDSKQQDAMQVPMSFGKNEDTADMKLDFAFDSDLSQLSDDKTNQSMHVGQSGAADLNQKIASVKKVWDSPSSMSGHVVEESGGGGGAGGSSAFAQGFPSDKGLDPTSAPHHPDHNDFNTPDSVYGSAQLTGGSGGGGGGAGAYAGAASMMKGADTIVSNTSTMCKTANMFQVSAQPQQMAVMTHPGPLSTPPPMANVLSFQANYASNLSAVPSPPNVIYNSQQGSGAPPQAELYQSYSLGGAGTRSYTDFPPSYNMSQSNTFQPNVYMQSAPGPQSVFQNHNQYRIPPHGSAALSQQMSSNPSTMLMSSSTNSVVSASQVKSNQGSLQPTAIGSKSGGGPTTGAPTYPQSTQIVLIESPSTVGFLHQGYHRSATIQPSSSFFGSSGLGPAGSTGGLFNSSLLSGGGGGAGTGSLPPSGSPFGVQPGAPSQYSQQQQPTSSHQQALYPTQPPQQPVAPQMSGGGFRSQPGGGYPKAGQQHPSDSVKSSQSDQFSSMFQQSVQGKGTRGMSLVKGQPQSSGSPQPQQNKFAYNSAAMQAGPYQQAPPNTVPQSRQPSQQVMRGGGGVSVGVVPSQATRYISPIQRPHPPPTYSQQQQQQAVAMLQARQQRNLQQVRGAPQQQQQPGGPQQREAPPQQQQQPSQQPKQYYQQGGGMKPEPGEGGAKSGEVEDVGKSVQDKTPKDDLSSQQQDQ